MLLLLLLQGAPGCMKDYVVVCTGELEHFNRDQVEKMIEMYGGRTTSELPALHTSMPRVGTAPPVPRAHALLPLRYHSRRCCLRQDDSSADGTKLEDGREVTTGR